MIWSFSGSESRSSSARSVAAGSGGAAPARGGPASDHGVQAESITAEDAASLGQDALRVIIGALEACVEAGQAASRDTFADAVALWLGLHGLAHQRTLSASFPGLPTSPNA
ncbi:TetR-like C-terminal domain-containing protein [Actinoplanes sp. NPDC051475]|uniref:TetR-like C-terminal domain-containing protein n=1 Tax=Actinoplanes sp. NPDC051475 TaxID=3157225 RepID=UPI00344E3333